MINKANKNEIRQKRHRRVREYVNGTASRPRLSVYRSTTHIYAQLIDDEKQVTLCSSSTVAKDLDVKGMTKVEAAEAVGKNVAEKAKALGIEKAVFDRGGYLYIGRVKALAEGARSGGLTI
ncbi:MAG: 50S ribosomal protein L18 [Clostridia bacterium]|nr:50S ribosomal protein L18 [Clostridia bacterium]